MYNYAIRMCGGAISVNPLREVRLTAGKKDSEPRAARQVSVDEVRQILIDIRTSKQPCPWIPTKGLKKPKLRTAPRWPCSARGPTWLVGW